MTVRYLSAAELRGLHELIMGVAGTAADLLDEGKLESASLRPMNLAHYENASLYAQAAVLISGIALAHAFSDGNKRLALLAGDTFLRLNGVLVQAEQHQFAQQILDLVNRPDALSDAAQRLTFWLEHHATPTQSSSSTSPED